MAPSSTVRRASVLAAAVVVALALALGVPGLAAADLAQDVPLTFDDETPVQPLPDYGDRGLYALGYVHDAYVTVTVPVHNRGRVGVTITDVEPLAERLAMLTIDGADARGEALPVAVGAGETVELTLRGRFDNCEYYTERALSVIPGLTVGTRTFGVPGRSEVRFEHDLVVRSPAIVDCPDRVSDRSANQRGDVTD